MNEYSIINCLFFIPSNIRARANRATSLHAAMGFLVVVETRVPSPSNTNFKKN
jgi:hypothetical protein